jgi:GT2 family glycosyltransferase
VAHDSSKIFYFVAVNYNSSNHTIKYLDSITRLKKQDYNIEVIIVDNASSNEDLQIIETSILGRPNTRLLKNNENIGYFRALNIGLSAIQEKNTLIIVGNNDIEFHEDFLLNLNTIVYENDIFVIAPNIITRDGFHQNPHCAERLSIFRKTGYRLYFSNYYLGQLLFWITQKIKKPRSAQREEDWNYQRVIHMGFGACYILTENYFKYFNALDDRVFLWGEEALLAGQVTSVGGKILYDPTIIVQHKESGSVATIPSKQTYRITKQSHRTYSRYL